MAPPLVGRNRSAARRSRPARSVAVRPPAPFHRASSRESTSLTFDRSSVAVLLVARCVAPSHRSGQHAAEDGPSITPGTMMLNAAARPQVSGEPNTAGATAAMTNGPASTPMRMEPPGHRARGRSAPISAPPTIAPTRYPSTTSGNDTGRWPSGATARAMSGTIRNTTQKTANFRAFDTPSARSP